MKKISMPFHFVQSALELYFSLVRLVSVPALIRMKEIAGREESVRATTHSP